MTNTMVDRADRELAIQAIELLWEDPRVLAEEEAAYLEMIGDFGEAYDYDDDDDNDVAFKLADEIICWWRVLDRPLSSDGHRPVEHLLSVAESMRPGARRYLEALGRSRLRVYEVIDIRVGESLRLRDLVSERELEVAEVSGSQNVAPFSLLVARVVEPGVSGQPEIDGGVLQLPRGMRDSVLAELRHPDARADGQVGLVGHQAWLSSLIQRTPEMANTDGEKIEPAKLVFRVRDRKRLLAGLADWDGLDPMDEGDVRSWSWAGASAKNDNVSLARLELIGDRLFIHVNSRNRGERAKEELLAVASEAVEYRMMMLQDMEQLVAQHRAEGPASNVAANLIPIDLQESIVLDRMSKHYQGWLDESLPLLEDATPRQAAQDPRRRRKLVEALKDLENIYYRALKSGSPAYDPSWMWSELGLGDEVDAPKTGALPPAMAHESIARLVPGLGKVVKEAASSLRARPDFDDQTVYAARECTGLLDVQRFLKKHTLSMREAGEDADVAQAAAEVLAEHLAYSIQHELHARKTFWVEAGLTVMLDATETDAPSDLLRLPFASLALVFGDRYALSLAERLLSRDTDHPLTGHKLRSLTAYVHELQGPDGRAVQVTFALDALGAVWPSLLTLNIPAHPDLDLDECTMNRRLVSGSKEIAGSPLVAQLLGLAINAILYATSATTELTRSAAPPKPKSPSKKAPAYSADEVFRLPGHIDIQLVAQLQALERAPTGRQIMQRFMVRGHWRRPNPNWEDRRPRWIEPYWKGPDMAATIERAYRLRPGEELDDPAPTKPDRS